MNPMNETDSTTPPTAGGTTPANTSTTAPALYAKHTTRPVRGETRTYVLSPKTHRLPKRVEKKLVRYLKLRARAGAMYGEASELLQDIMAETRGSSRVRVIEPGLVYAFSTAITVDGKQKGTVQIVDQFAQPEVTAIKVINRFEVKTWKGDGPASDRHTRLAARAESKVTADTEEDALP